MKMISNAEKNESEFQPITGIIEPTKQAARRYYGFHPYFTTRPFNVVREYISHFSSPGDTVLDPFTGSGVTNVESLILKRKTIGVDLAPLACFITRNACVSPVDLNVLNEHFRKIKESVSEEIGRVDSMSEKEAEKMEVPYWYPKGVRLPKNSDVEFVEELFTRNQLIGLSTLRHEIEKIKDKTMKDLLLLAFSSTIATTNKMFRRRGSSPYTQYRYWVPKEKETSNIEMTRVWDRFKTRFENVVEAKKETNLYIGKFYSEENCKIFQHSATKLDEIIPEKSVDYIFTDPPYGAHIAYLDLSTMWHAWLGFEVEEEDRELEVIEGGEVEHTKEDYIDLLNQSFVQMSKVLKSGGWLSLVFHHKEARLWYAIRDAAKNVGLEYANTVVQPTKLKSWHKVSNPLKVLATELIVNFRKTTSPVTIQEYKSIPARQVILNAAEREIIKRGGATLEEIMGGVVPDLFEHNLIDKAATSTTDDVLKLLEQEFYLDKETNLWHIKEENKEKIGHYIPTKDRIKYYAVSLLRREKTCDFDTIVIRLLPLLINGHEPTSQEILEVLEEIGFSKDGINWQLKDSAISFQQTLFDSAARPVEPKTELSSSTEHNRTLHKVASLGRKMGFVVKVGNRELSDPVFSEFSSVKELPFNYKNETQRKRVEQIDCIWLHKDGTPLYAFEIEEHTSILSALERFWALLEINPALGNEGRLTIVVPTSRRRKARQELGESSFIGHPQFMERKVKYIFREEFEKNYERMFTSKNLTLKDMDNLTNRPE